MDWEAEDREAEDREVKDRWLRAARMRSATDGQVRGPAASARPVRDQLRRTERMAPAGCAGSASEKGVQGGKVPFSVRKNPSGVTAGYSGDMAHTIA